LQSLSNQRHDFNVGMGPDVGSVPGGNNFGTRVFWTAAVPDRDVQVDPGAGTAEVHVPDLAALDYPEDFGSGSLGPNWQTAYVPATVSFDIVWSRPVTPQVTVRDATDQFAGTFSENQATVTWSAHSSSGFRFQSLPGNASTSTQGVPDITTSYFFAEVGHEQNGVFFPSGSGGRDEGHGGSAPSSKPSADIPSLAGESGAHAPPPRGRHAGRTALDGATLFFARSASGPARADARQTSLPPQPAGAVTTVSDGNDQRAAAASRPAGHAVRLAFRRAVDRVFARLESGTFADALHVEDGAT
jgi:hypothetical protein